MVKANSIIALVVFLIILCAVLAVCLLYKSNVEIIKKSRHYHNKALIYNEYSFDDESLVYLVCDKDALSNCKIVQEKYPFRKPYRTCNATLDGVGRLSEKSVIAAAFGRDAAVLFWKGDNGHFVRFRFVNLAKCEQKEIRMLNTPNIQELRDTKKIVTYEQSFVVFYKNFYECGYNECFHSFNRSGLEMEYAGPKPALANAAYDIKNIYPVDAQVPHEKYVYEKSRGKYSTITWQRLNGTSKILTNTTGKIKISVIDESIGVCSRIGNNTNCFQYNSNGDFKLNVSLTDVNNVTDFQSMYTLPEGGFLLSFSDTRCEEGDECDGSTISNYFIEKIDDTGKSIRKLRVQGLEKGFKSIQHSHIWKVENKDEYCAFIVPTRGKSDKIEFLVNCFPISNYEE